MKEFAFWASIVLFAFSIFAVGDFVLHPSGYIVDDRRAIKTWCAVGIAALAGIVLFWKH